MYEHLIAPNFEAVSRVVSGFGFPFKRLQGKLLKRNWNRFFNLHYKSHVPAPIQRYLAHKKQPPPRTIL